MKRPSRPLQLALIRMPEQLARWLALVTALLLSGATGMAAEGGLRLGMREDPPSPPSLIFSNCQLSGDVNLCPEYVLICHPARTSGLALEVEFWTVPFEDRVAFVTASLPPTEWLTMTLTVDGRDMLVLVDTLAFHQSHAAGYVPSLKGLVWPEFWQALNAGTAERAPALTLTFGQRVFDLTPNAADGATLKAWVEACLAPEADRPR